MAKYSDIKGFTVQTLSTDTVANQGAGGAWASGGSLNAVKQNLGGLGSQTAALAIGGFIPSPPGGTVDVEQYNGSSWTEIANLNAAIASNSAAGTTTAGMTFGGAQPPSTRQKTAEVWDGSSWTEVGDFSGAVRQALTGGGTTTAAIAAAGYTTDYAAIVETCHGS